MKLPIYLDYAATTPVDPRVAEKMMGCLTQEGNFGNPASRSHLYGWRAEEAVEQAREQVAALIEANPREIVWTSGATEANNLAIKGVAQFYRQKGCHIITSKIEHKAVLDVCGYLHTQGFEVTYLTPDSTGQITVEQVRDALRSDTILVSIMHVNNELGTLNDISAIAQLCRSRGVLMHVDAAQSAGKIPLNVRESEVDLISFSAHKLYGPKGAGALYVRRTPSLKLQAQMHGGGHERGYRSGTLATHQIVGMGAAFELAKMEMADESQRIQYLRDRFQQGLAQIPNITYNGHVTQHVPGILNYSFADVEGESLLMALKDIAVSSGSACTSATLEPSYVLRAIGVSDELAHSSIRFSLGRFTTEWEIDQAIATVVKGVERLRSLSSHMTRR